MRDMAGTSLPQIAHPLLHVDVDLLARTLLHDGATPAPSRRPPSLAEQTAQAQLESIVAHVEQVAADVGDTKRARNLIASLCSIVLTQWRDDDAKPRKTIERPRRVELLFAWLYRLDASSVLHCVHRLLQGSDKMVLLRVYWMLRDCTKALLLANATEASAEAGWEALLDAAVRDAVTYTTVQENSQSPTKLSVAAADAGLYVAHVLALGTLDAGNFRPLTCALLRRVAAWYAHKPARSLWVAGITDLLSYETDPAFAYEYHHSGLLLQSIAALTHESVLRGLSHLQNARSGATALRNLALVLGRQKTALLLPTALELVRAVSTYLEPNPKALSWALVDRVLHQPGWDEAARSPLLVPVVSHSLVSPAVRPLVARRLVDCNDALTPLLDVIRDASTSLATLQQSLGLVRCVVQQTGAPRPTWFRPLSVAILEVYFYHPAQVIRDECLWLLPRLDLPSVFAACGASLQRAADGPLVHLTLAFLFARYNDTLFEELLNLTKEQSCLETLSPADKAAQTTKLLSLLPPWLRTHVPPSARRMVTDQAVACFFADATDGVSLHALRLVHDAWPSMFPRIFCRLVTEILTNARAITVAHDDPTFPSVLRPYLGLRASSFTQWATCDERSLQLLQTHLVQSLCNDAASSTVLRVLSDLVAKLPPANVVPDLLARLPHPSVRQVVSDKAVGVLIYTLAYLVAHRMATFAAWGAPVIAYLGIALSVPAPASDEARHDQIFCGLAEIPLALLHTAVTTGDLAWIYFFLDAVVAGAWHRPDAMYPACTRVCRKETAIGMPFRIHLSIILLRLIQNAPDLPRCVVDALVQSVADAFAGTTQSARDNIDGVSLSLEIVAQLIMVNAVVEASDVNTRLVRTMVDVLTIQDLSDKMTLEVLETLSLVLSAAPAIAAAPPLPSVLLRQCTASLANATDEAIASLCRALIVHLEAQRGP
ncbi:hypothetical protein SDRG_05990 [Saprolegnia diclina VS20]|uniref:Uncharacterized protein n=1 Tax=Saprolegnia diclina (strain VS20) TaxID=1156394 RepID=T0QP89_SAPDV|nr:hypothetical protein SDRG_05990 [Saprolegnia diclina VS20]EQC36541.1 hypothetical protein SDRG_05990 [Saprolegnia diclina VS20]|eukprot:XP_008609962.1 hypothetical protein SDRG_05990 [Saprolegnia diclina VS20]